jgi:ribosomal protein S15P/S13E
MTNTHTHTGDIDGESGFHVGSVDPTNKPLNLASPPRGQMYKNMADASAASHNASSRALTAQSNPSHANIVVVDGDGPRPSEKDQPPTHEEAYAEFASGAEGAQLSDVHATSKGEYKIKKVQLRDLTRRINSVTKLINEVTADVQARAQIRYVCVLRSIVWYSRPCLC